MNISRNSLMYVSACIKQIDEDILGTGSIIVVGEYYYLLTCDHVIRNNNELIPSESLQAYLTIGKNVIDLAILDIKVNKVLDLAALQISKPNVDFDYKSTVLLGFNNEPKDEYCLYGFPGILLGHGIYLDCEYQNGDSYKLKFNMQTIDEPKQNYVGGFSGSGVFIDRLGTLYLVAIVKNIDKNMPYDVVHTVAANEYDAILGTKSVDLVHDDLTHIWDEKLDSLSRKQLFESLRNVHSDYLLNLERKIKVIYGDNIEKKIECRIDDYLKGDKVIVEMRKLFAPLTIRLLKEDENFQDYLNRYIVSHCDNIREAEQKFAEVRTQLLKQVSPILQEYNYNDVVEQYVNYKLAEMLMNCNINFEL